MPVSSAQTPPRLHGENPPQSMIDQAQKVTARVRESDTIANLSFGIGLMLILAMVVIHFATPTSIEPMYGILLVAAAAIVIYYAYRDKREALQKEVAALPTQVPLDAFNTEFTSPLADHATLRITVHFQIPSNLAQTASSSYQMVPSNLVENLNRITEAKLIIYTQPFTEPPSREDLEEFLNRALVQFQDENNISVMRVNVPIAIRVQAPEKPKSVNV
jgi:Ca2+/Na+ antiporter